MSLTNRARGLRLSQTPAERTLWYALCDRRLGGYKFKRQLWVDHFIVDFICLKQRLIVEIDGGQHAEAKTYDEERTNRLIAHGYRVVRFWNNEVLINLEGVLQQLLRELGSQEQAERTGAEGCRCRERE